MSLCFGDFEGKQFFPSITPQDNLSLYGARLTLESLPLTILQIMVIHFVFDLDANVEANAPKHRNRVGRSFYVRPYLHWSGLRLCKEHDPVEGFTRGRVGNEVRHDHDSTSTNEVYKMRAPSRQRMRGVDFQRCVAGDRKRRSTTHQSFAGEPVLYRAGKLATLGSWPVVKYKGQDLIILSPCASMVDCDPLCTLRLIFNQK
ncbi:hypothetical protein B0H16DRAFT_1684098 [Mycena metata]|uniref:Uncharacterized protein n=1 Tax=Mycena metata TaxID=1033252 RepID=A0AAD7K5E2_9AGAR|nr:hypothetical protein B0H16DRAFT_1684098 [Mycena metata]